MLPIVFFLIGPNIGHNTITDNVRLKQIHQTFAAELAEILRPLEFGAVPHYAPQFLTLNQPMNLETKKKRREKKHHNLNGMSNVWLDSILFHFHGLYSDRLVDCRENTAIGAH